MAKTDNISYTGFDFGDEFDINDPLNTNQGASAAPKGRKPVQEFTGGVYGGIYDSFTDVDKAFGDIRQAMPRPFVETFKTFDDASATFRRLYDHADKELAEYTEELTGQIDDLVPERFQRLKKITSSIKDRFKRLRPTSGGDEEKMMIDNILGEVERNRDQSQDDVSFKQDVALSAKTEKREQVRHQQVTELLSRIDDNIHRDVRMTELVDRPFQKKSLEVGIRQYVVQNKILRELRDTRLEQSAILKAIGKNTGLPDSVKESTSDRFKDNIRRRTVGSIQDRLFGQGSLFQTALARLEEDGRKLIDSAKTGLMVGTMGAGSIKDIKDQLDTGMISMPQFLGETAGQMLGGKAREKLIDKGVNRLFANDNIMSKGLDIANAVQDPREMLDNIRKSDRFQVYANSAKPGAQYADNALRYVQDLFKPRQGDTSLDTQTGIGTGMSPGGYSRHTDNVVTKAIPSYLARILQQVTLSNNQGTSVPLYRYDPETGELRESSDLKSTIKAKLLKTYANSGMQAEVDKTAELIKFMSQSQASVQDLTKVAYKLITELDKAASAKNIRNSELYDNASESERKVLDELARSIGGGDVDSKLNLNKLRSQLIKSRSDTTSLGASIQQMTDTGLLPELVEEGLVKRGKDGSHNLNLDLIRKMQMETSAEVSGMTREEREAKYGKAISDVRMKENITSTSPKSSLNRIRNIPIKLWNYIQDARKKQKIGPMAQDVRQQLGEETAPDGTSLDLVNMNGHLMAAVQQLAEDQDSIKSALKSPARPRLGSKKGSALTAKPEPSVTELQEIRLAIDRMHETLKGKTMLGIPSVNLDPKALKEMLVEASTALAENTKEGFVKAGKKAKGLAKPLIETGNEYLDTLQSLIVSATGAGYQKTKEIGGRIIGKATKAGRSTTDFVSGVLPEKETVQAELKRLSSLAYQGGLKIAAFTQKTLFKTIPEKLEQGVQKMVSTFFDVKTGIKTLLNGPRDIYLPGQDSPTLLAVRMRNGFYFTVSGKPIKNIDDLLQAKEDIVDTSTNDIALRWRDTADGLFDREGKRLNTTTNNVMGFVGAVAYKGIQNLKSFANQFGNKDGESLWDKTKNLFGGMRDSFSRFGNVGVSDKRQLGLLAQIRDLLAWGKPKKVLNNVYGRKLDDESHLVGQAFLTEAISEKFKALFGEAKAGVAEQAGGSKDAGTDATGKSPSSSTTDPLNFDKGFAKIGETLEKIRSEGFSAAMPKTAKAADTIKNKVKDRFSWITNKFKRPQSVTEGTGEATAAAPSPTDWKGQMLSKVQQETANREAKQAGWFQKAKQLTTRETPVPAKGGDPGTANMLKSFVGELRGIFQGVGRKLTSATAGPAPVMAGGDEAMGPPRPGRMAGFKGKMGRVLGAVGGKLKGLGGLGMSLLSGAGGMLGGLLGGPTVGREISDNGPMISSTTPAASRPEVRGRRDGNDQNDSDGDGYRDGGNVEMGRRQAEENTARKDAERQKAESSRQEAKAEAFRYKTENAIDSLLNGAKGLFSMISSGVSSVLGLAGSFFGAKGLLGMLGGKGMFGKLLSGGKNLVGKGFNAVKTVGRPLASLGTAAKATRVVSAVGTGLRVAQVAGLAAGGLGLVGSGLAAVGTAVLGVISSPVVLGAAAIGAVGYGIYKGYKYFTRNKVDDFQKMRVLQYGLTTESSDIHRVLALEAYLEDGKLIYDTSGVRLNTKVVEEKELLDIFGIDKKDQERIGRFTYWFGQRFLPFFLSSCTALLNINKKFKLKDVEKLNAEELKDFVERSKSLDGPYNVDASPFAGIDKLPDTQGEVDKVAKALWSKKPSKAEDKKNLADSVTKNPQTIANQTAQKNEAKADDLQRGRDNQITSNKVEAERKGFLSRFFSKDSEPSKKEAVLPNAQKGDDGGKKPTEQAQVEQSRTTVSTSRAPSAKGGLYGPEEGLNHLSVGKDANIANMDPTLWKNFLSMVTEYGKMTGKKVQVNEAFRSYERQSELYQANPRKAARPGTSMHEKGLAIDISTADANALEKMGLMTKYGFTRPIGGESWHIEPAGIQASPDRAKRDPSWTAQQVQASLGRGGGGYGSVSGSPLGRRNPQLAKALFESGPGVEKGPPPQPKDQAEIDKKPTTALARLPEQGPSALAETTKTVTDAEPASSGKSTGGNTYAQKWMGKRGASEFDKLGPKDSVVKVVGPQANRFPEMFYDPTGNPLTKEGVEKQMADRFGRLSRNFGTAPKEAGVETTQRTLASSTKAEQDTTTAKPVKEKKPVMVEDSMMNRNQMVKPKETDNSVTAVRSMVNGVEPLMKESVKLEAEMVSLMRGDMMPVLRSMNETLSKMYEHNVKNSSSSTPTAPEAPKPMAAAPGVTPASTSTLPRQRKYG